MRLFDTDQCFCSEMHLFFSFDFKKMTFLFHKEDAHVLLHLHMFSLLFGRGELC